MGQPKEIILALETVTYISDLNEINPTSTDPVKQGDDHIRNIKKGLKNTFPNVNDAVTVTPAELNHLDGAAENIQTQIHGRARGDRVITAGNGLTGGGALWNDVTINHADTSTQPSQNSNSGTTIIQRVALDGFGHVTSLTSKTLAASDFAALTTSADHQSDDGVGYSQGYNVYDNPGSLTLNYANGNYAAIDRRGNLTINAQTNGRANSVIAYIKNDGAATGSITLSGYTKVTGDSFDNANNSRWFIFSTYIRSNKHAHVVKIN